MEGDQLGGCHSHAGKGDGRTLFTSTRRNSPEQSIGERDKPTMQHEDLLEHISTGWKPFIMACLGPTMQPGLCKKFYIKQLTQSFCSSLDANVSVPISQIAE